MPVDTTDRRIRDAIRAEIKTRGISQRQFAFEVGMFPEVLYRLLAGGRARQPEALIRILDALDLELVVMPKKKLEEGE